VLRILRRILEFFVGIERKPGIGGDIRVTITADYYQQSGRDSD